MAGRLEPSCFAMEAPESTGPVLSCPLVFLLLLPLLLLLFLFLSLPPRPNSPPHDFGRRSRVMFAIAAQGADLAGPVPALRPSGGAWKKTRGSGASSRRRCAIRSELQGVLSLVIGGGGPADCPITGAVEGGIDCPAARPAKQSMRANRIRNLSPIPARNKQKKLHLFSHVVVARIAVQRVISSGGCILCIGPV